jgi:hypothetical protein
MKNPRYKNGFTVTVHVDFVDASLHRKTPRKVFVKEKLVGICRVMIPITALEDLLYN